MLVSAGVTAPHPSPSIAHCVRIAAARAETRRLRRRHATTTTRRLRAKSVSLATIGGVWAARRETRRTSRRGVWRRDQGAEGLRRPAIRVGVDSCRHRRHQVRRNTADRMASRHETFSPRSAHGKRRDRSHKNIAGALPSRQRIGFPLV